MNTEINPVYHAAAEAVLLTLPGIKAGKAFGYPAYKVNGKVFAFFGSNGLILKLPEMQVAELIASDPVFQPFSPAEGIVWKAWVSLRVNDPADYANQEGLMLEALTFVAEGAK
jgi:hypothetical protein